MAAAEPGSKPAPCPAVAAPGWRVARWPLRPVAAPLVLVGRGRAARARGSGSALTGFAVERIRAAGKRLAVVETGGDPGHAPARATYRRAGFVGLPAERYYLLL